MRVVLYADDMEPITVIELSALAEEYLRKRGMVRLAVQSPPMSISSVLAVTQTALDDLKTVTLLSERIIRNGHEHMMLFTYDEESALLLKCAFLPGQQATIQECQRTAFARGFLQAIEQLG